MPAIVWVVIAIVLLVGGLLAVDWVTAGRTKRRMLVRARDQSATDLNVGYGVIMTQTRSNETQGGGGLV